MATLMFTGAPGDLALLKHETGLHRLQRVPLHERRGRVHSSTVSVAWFGPCGVPSNMAWDPADCEVAWFSGSGAGGQHRNKHANCARIVHRPTGLVRTAQTRSRAQSHMEALAALKTAVESSHAERALADQHADRLAQIGKGNQGSERARLWAFQRGMVEDQRTGRQMPLKAALRAHLRRLWPSQA